MFHFLVPIFVTTSLSLYCFSILLHVHIAEVVGSLGDPCTQNDISNCTGSETACSQNGDCECVLGYLADADGIGCRKPGNSETCVVEVGCNGTMLCEEIEGLTSCQCDDSVTYYVAKLNQCVEKPSLNQTCGADIYCQDFYDCVGTPKTCQCNSSGFYFDTYTYKCRPVGDVEVSALSTTPSTTSVTFKWFEEAPSPGVQYSFDWSPHDGQIASVYELGGQVSGLKPGHQYNFSVVYQISQSPYYPDKSYTGPFITLWTNALFDEECNKNTVCDDSETSCMKAMDGINRCLCNEEFYNTTENGACSSVTDLMVSTISSISTDTTLNLTWNSNTNMTSLTYRVQWLPQGGHVDWITSSGAFVSGLRPGTTYYISVTTVLPADGYNKEKSVSVSDYVVGTDLPADASCTSTAQCLDGTICTTATDGQLRCLCDNSSYFNDRINKCVDLSDLKMSAWVTSKTDSIVVFYWAQEDPLSPAQNEIQWAPHDGDLDYTNMEGGEVSGLRPGSQYNFTFLSVLRDGKYSPEKQYVAAVMTVWTKVPYAGECSASTPCQDSNATCTEARDKLDRCLCVKTMYNQTQNGTCSSLNDLIVTNISSISSETTIILRWAPPTTSIPLTFKLQWTPGEGRAEQISSTGAVVSFLPTRTTFNFSVTSVLSADGYNQEKSVTAPAYFAKTDFSYLSNCTPAAVEVCQDGTSCIRGTDGVFRCLCGNSTYFNEEYGRCYNLTDLKVSASASATATTVTIYWSDDDPYSLADQDLEWAPHDGGLDNENLEGAMVSSLRSGTQYNFTVVSLIRGEEYTPDKTYVGPVITIWTKSLQGDQCDKPASCQDNSTSCIQATDKINRCLCGNFRYNKTQTGNCSSLEDLKVSNVSATTSSTTATFTWTVTIHVPAVIYNLEWTPTGGRVDNVSSTGAHVVGLNPDTAYSFSVFSVLPATSYEQKKQVFLQISVVATKAALAQSSSDDSLKPGLGAGLTCTVVVVVGLLALGVYKNILPAPRRLRACCNRGNLDDSEPFEGGHEDGEPTTPHTEGQINIKFDHDDMASSTDPADAENISLEDISESLRSPVESEYGKNQEEEEEHSRIIKEYSDVT